MINSKFENICLEDSYLLGWHKSIGTMTFNVELLLTENHHMFEPYDDEIEHGCYKIGKITISGYDAVEGLPFDRQPMKLNNRTNEYDDVAEIDEISELDDVVKIEADEYCFLIKGGNLSLIFD